MTVYETILVHHYNAFTRNGSCNYMSAAVVG